MNVLRDSRGLIYQINRPHSVFSNTLAYCPDSSLVSLYCNPIASLSLPHYMSNATSMGLDASDNAYYLLADAYGCNIVQLSSAAQMDPTPLSSFTSNHSCSNETAPIAVSLDDTLYTTSANGTSIMLFSLTRCPDFHYCTEGASNATLCPAGHYCPEQ